MSNRNGHNRISTVHARLTTSLDDTTGGLDYIRLQQPFFPDDEPACPSAGPAKRIPERRAGQRRLAGRSE